MPDGHVAQTVINCGARASQFIGLCGDAVTDVSFETKGATGTLWLYGMGGASDLLLFTYLNSVSRLK